jgi:hypothetical protein
MPRQGGRPSGGTGDAGGGHLGPPTQAGATSGFPGGWWLGLETCGHRPLVDTPLGHCVGQIAGPRCAWHPAKRDGCPVLGVEKVLAQDPCQRLGKSKKSPAPMLFFAERREVRDAMRNDYKDFEDAYEIGVQRLIEAAAQGYRLDSRRHLPDGSFPPSVIEEILSTAGGFNPEAEFPRRSFPRPWPFVGGQLVPPPPDPPSRQLVFATIDGKETIVWRGEIPSVHVPHCLDLDLHEGLTTTLTPNASPKEVQSASRDPARDPP